MPVIRWRGFHSYRDYKKFTVYTCVTIVRARRLRGLMSRGVNGCPGQFLANVDQAPYCASLTCSSQSTTLPSSASAIAMCVIAVVSPAPCQCFSPGANQTTSPGRICSTGPPSRCARPLPTVTISVCPSGCVCQAVRAPGSNVTLAPLTRAGSGALNSGSMRTVPVNHSPGPLPEGCVPFRLISIALSSGDAGSARFTYLRLLDFRDCYHARRGLLGHLSSNASRLEGPEVAILPVPAMR